MYPKHPERKFFFAEKRHHYLFKLYRGEAKLNNESLIKYYIKTEDLPVILFLINSNAYLFNDDVMRLLISNLKKEKNKSEIIRSLMKFSRSIFFSSTLGLILHFGNILNDLSDKKYTEFIKLLLDEKIDFNENIDFNQKIYLFSFGKGKLSFEKVKITLNLLNFSKKVYINLLFNYSTSIYLSDTQKESLIYALNNYKDNKFLITDTKLLNKLMQWITLYDLVNDNIDFIIFNYDNIDFRYIIEAESEILFKRLGINNYINNITKVFFLKKTSIENTNKYINIVIYKILDHSSNDLIKNKQYEKDMGYNMFNLFKNICLKNGLDLFESVDENGQDLLRQIWGKILQEIKIREDGYFVDICPNILSLDLLNFLMIFKPNINKKNNNNESIFYLIFKYHLKIPNILLYYDLNDFDWNEKINEFSTLDNLFKTIKFSTEKTKREINKIDVFIYVNDENNITIIEKITNYDIKQIYNDQRIINYLLNKKCDVFLNRNKLFNIIKLSNNIDSNTIEKVLDKIYGNFQNYKNQHYKMEEYISFIKSVIDYLLDNNIFDFYNSSKLITNLILEFSPNYFDLDFIYEKIENGNSTANTVSLLHKVFIYGNKFKKYLQKKVYYKLKYLNFEFYKDFMHEWTNDKNYGPLVSYAFIIMDEPLKYDHILCFGLLDDCNLITKKCIKCKKKDLKYAFRVCYQSAYYFEPFFGHPLFHEPYYEKLISEKYITWNQIEKYYCISFALDYQVFDIWSKGYPRREID